MGGEVLVALLVTVVLGDEVEVLATDDDGAVHLGGNDGTGQDTAADGDLAGEGALLVCSNRQFISAICSSFSFHFVSRQIAPLPCRHRSLARDFALVVSRCVLFAFNISCCRMFCTRRFAFRNKAGGRSRKSRADLIDVRFTGVHENVPMYWPSMAAAGVRKPRPTSLYHLRPPLPGRADLTLVLLLRKTLKIEACQRAQFPHCHLFPCISSQVQKLTVRLLLESALALHGQFGSHLAGRVMPKMVLWYVRGEIGRKVEIPRGSQFCQLGIFFGA